MKYLNKRNDERRKFLYKDTPSHDETPGANVPIPEKYQETLEEFIGGLEDELSGLSAEVLSDGISLEETINLLEHTVLGQKINRIKPQKSDPLVLIIQTALTHLGYDLVVDGYVTSSRGTHSLSKEEEFRTQIPMSNTNAATYDFQTKYRGQEGETITADGILGPETSEALLVSLKKLQSERERLAYEPLANCRDSLTSALSKEGFQTSWFDNMKEKKFTIMSDDLLLSFDVNLDTGNFTVSYRENGEDILLENLTTEEVNNTVIDILKEKYRGVSDKEVFDASSSTYYPEETILGKYDKLPKDQSRDLRYAMSNILEEYKSNPNFSFQDGIIKISYNPKISYTNKTYTIQQSEKNNNIEIKATYYKENGTEYKETFIITNSEALKSVISDILDEIDMSKDSG